MVIQRSLGARVLPASNAEGASWPGEAQPLKDEYMRRVLHSIHRAIHTTPVILRDGPDGRSLRLRLPTQKPKQLSPGLWELFQGLRVRIVLGARGATGREVLAREGGGSMPKAGYYAVAAGRRPGVYTTWDEAEQQVKGFPGAKYKKFPTNGQALSYIQSGSSTPYTSASSREESFSTSSRSTAHEAPVALSSLTSAKNGRVHSPPRHAASQDLPPNLMAIAERGFKFSEGTPRRLVVYADGSSLDNGKVGARAGLGVWWGDHGEAAESNLAERVPGVRQTNNRGELLAAIRAIEACPCPEVPLEIRTDSQYTISCVTTWLPAWIRNGFKTAGASRQGKTLSYSGTKTDVKNADIIKHLYVLLRQRSTSAGVRFKYVPGHEGWEGNEAADRLARTGAGLPVVPDRTDWLDPDVEDTVDHSAPAAHVEIEVDESWLLTADELERLERDFEEDASQ